MQKNIIFVDNFITECLIGIYPREKKGKQKIKVSVKLTINRTQSSDNISGTVCYQKVYKILEGIINYDHINLVETLANKLADKFEQIENVNKIDVKISKCEISQAGTDIGFILERFRK